MKKLIEVALPLDVINKASAREKSIRHGHPSTLHLWWSRKPTATARAVLFASTTRPNILKNFLHKNFNRLNANAYSKSLKKLLRGKIPVTKKFLPKL